MIKSSFQSVNFHCFILFFIIMMVCPLLVLSEPLYSSGQTLKSGCEYDYPPYCFVQNNAAAGFSVELLSVVMQKMNMSVKFRTDYWNVLKEDLKNGQLDVLPLVGRTPEREEIYDFTIPYLPMHGAIIVRENNKDIHSIDDLAGKVIAVMKGDNAEEFIRRQDLKWNIVTTKTFPEALTNLSEGKYDAVIVQRLLGLQLIHDLKLKNLKVIEPSLKEFRQDFCFAVKEGNKELLALLNEGLAIAMVDGTFRELYDTWFSPIELRPYNYIVIGIDHNYPPWEYIDQYGNPAGYNVDLSRAIAREMDIKIHFYAAPWSNVKKALYNGRIDVLQGMFYSPIRAQIYDFSNPYFTVTQGIVTRADFPDIKEIGLLDTCIIIVQKGDIMHEYAVEHQFDSIIVFETTEDALNALNEGMGHCVFIDKIQALYLINNHNWSNMKIHNLNIGNYEYCYAVKKGNNKVLSILDQGLKIIKETGEYRRIREKWFGVDEPNILEVLFKYILIFVALLIIILSFVILWSIMLRKTVKRSTAELKSEVERRKNSEMILEEKKEYLQTTLKSIGDGVIVTDIEGRITEMNPIALKLTGFAQEDAIGKQLRDVFHIINALTGEPVIDPVQKVLSTGEIVGLANHTMLISRDGTKCQIADSGAPIIDNENNISGVVMVFRDVTEEYNIRQKLILNEQKLKELFDRMSTCVAIYRALDNGNDFEFTDINKSAERVENISKDEIIGKRVTEVFPGIDEFGLLDVFKEVFKTGIPQHYPIKYYEDSQRSGWRKNYIFKLFTNEIVSVYDDLTEIKESEEALDESKRHYKILFDTMAQGAVYQDAKGNIVSANNAAEKILGLSMDELLGRTSMNPEWRAVDEDGRELPGHKHPSMIALKEKRVVENFIQGVYNPKKKDYSWIIVNSMPLFRDGESEPYMVYSTFQDITELKKAQNELLKMDRMYSLGILAGGIAHDFNNILTGIMGNVALIHMDADNNHIKELSKDALGAIETAKNLTKQLLTFASGGEPVIKTINPSKLILETAKFSMHGSNVKLISNIAHDLWNIEADIGQIKQVIQNIVINAVQAMPKGGDITINARNIHINNHKKIKSGKYIVIEITDTGIGICKDILDRIFDPYFTTKQTGSGLGLAMSSSIIRKHNGYIDIKSTQGKGSIFTVYLPASDNEIEDNALSGEGIVLDGSRKGKILIMDDEAAIRKVSTKILSKAGYEVHTAIEGKDAVRLFKNAFKKAPFDIVILDLTVPGGMGGKDAAMEILNIDPAANLIVSSGYSDDAEMSDYLNRGFKASVSKPYKIHELINAIDKLLHGE